MASLKNVDKAKARIHKERSQPSAREHLGNLEKKKDYKQRAKHSQEKRDTIKVLRQKALDRNPDEFYFHMINSKCEDGIHNEKEKSDDEATFEQEKLMTTQNLRYVSFKLQQERRKIDKILASVHLCDPSLTSNTHTIFLDGKDEVKRFNASKRFGTHPSLIDRPFNRPKLSDLRAKPIGEKLNIDDIKATEKERKKVYQELTKRIVREKELRIVQEKLLAKKHINESKQKPKKIRSGNAERAPVYKWPQERKK